MITLLKKRTLYFLLISTLCSIIGITCQFINVGESFELRTWDFRARLIAPTRKPNPHIKIITIDQPSLTYFSDNDYIRWPWPRELYGSIIEFLKIAHARSIAFDIIFSEPSMHGVSDDEAFSSSIDTSLGVIAAVPLQFESAENTQATLEKLKPKLQREQKLISELPVFTRKSFLLPITGLLNKSATIGHVTGVPDRDGVYRAPHLVGLIENVLIPSLPFAQFLLNHHSLPVTLNSERRESALRFYGAEQTFETISFANITKSLVETQENKKPTIDPQIFKDAYVIVGMTAPGLMDLRPTPLSPTFPGVEINATALSNLLNDEFIRHSTPLFDICFILFCAVLFTIPLSTITSIKGRLLLSFSAISIILTIALATSFYGWWIPLFIPLSTGIFALLSGTFLQYRLEGAQHRFIRNAFQHYVNEEVVDQIVANPDKLSLGGERRTLSIFFSDLQGFTSLSEKLDPAKLSLLLNEYLTAMTDIILKSGGTLDKYEGDAIIAFWNAPLDVPDHATRAVKAAIACQSELQSLKAQFLRDYGVTLKMRIGINTGDVSVGNFGSKTRFNYTMIGDAANLASRLEGANKLFGTSILISEATKKHIPQDITLRTVGLIKVVGKNQSIKVFEPVTATSPDHEKAIMAFEDGLLEEALVLFKNIPQDRLTETYQERILRELENNAPFSPLWSLERK